MYGVAAEKEECVEESVTVVNVIVLEVNVPTPIPKQQSLFRMNGQELFMTL